MSTENKGKLLDEVRRKMRLLHYSIHTVKGVKPYLYTSISRIVEQLWFDP